MDNNITGKPLENLFNNLPDDVLTEILGRTSPLDVSRFAVISKGLKSAADSDSVWDRFLPKEVVSSLDSPVILGVKKELFFTLCKSPIHLHGGKLILYIDKKSGKKQFIVGSRALMISWGDSPGDWEWTSRSNSRFTEVAQLNSVNWLDIRGNIKAEMLSENTSYGAYLIFKLGDMVCGLDMVLEQISDLEEIPSDIGEITTLQCIDVSWLCSRAIRESAKRIQEEQESLGIEISVLLQPREYKPVD